MARPQPAWRRRPARAMAPFTEAEDAELRRMVTCGLSCDYYHIGLPGRAFGDILERRLQLIQSGELRPARPI